ncbi:hypothetical protein GQ42DRAFT_153479 [Ramicandelaber brevisporus]|nr:hypothetical protein GQ42DRAFT_153479 [Ramicandelaber brevisporus]
MSRFTFLTIALFLAALSTTSAFKLVNTIIGRYVGAYEDPNVSKLYWGIGKLDEDYTDMTAKRQSTGGFSYVERKTGRTMCRSDRWIKFLPNAEGTKDCIWTLKDDRGCARLKLRDENLYLGMGYTDNIDGWRTGTWLFLNDFVHQCYRIISTEDLPDYEAADINIFQLLGRKED